MYVHFVDPSEIGLHFEEIAALARVPIAAVVAIVFLVTTIRIVKEYQRAVVFRLGRLSGVRGPGLVLFE